MGNKCHYKGHDYFKQAFLTGAAMVASDWSERGGLSKALILKTAKLFCSVSLEIC